MMELVGKWSEHPKFFLKMVCMLGVGGDYENSFCRIWSISKISLMRITYTAVTVADNHARKPDTPEAVNNILKAVKGPPWKLMMTYLPCAPAIVGSQLKDAKGLGAGTPTSMVTQTKIMRLIAAILSQGTNSVKADRQAAGIKFQSPQWNYWRMRNRDWAEKPLNRLWTAITTY
jgi:hypothetical protein